MEREYWDPTKKNIIEKPYPLVPPPKNSKIDPFPTRPRAPGRPLKPTRGSRRIR